jgi:hypothetical protein
MPGTVYACSRLKKPRDISGNLIMLMCDLKCGWKKKSLRLSLWAVLMLLTYAHFPTSVNAQGSWPFENSFSPLASFPLLRGEAKLIPTFVTLKNGSLKGDIEGTNLNLNPYGFTFSGTGTFFLDLMARLQLSRFSVRGYLEQREFAGVETMPTVNDRSANLTYYGVRVGGDVDIFLGNRTRVGFNYDHSFYGPSITLFNRFLPVSNVSSQTTPLGLQGPESGTIGCHLIYNPVWDVFGTSAIFEGWAHWPIYGTALSDFEVSGGLKWADTVLGSGSIQGGYRWTNIITQDLSGTGNGNLNATWGGVFGEVVYYYR